MWPGQKTFASPMSVTAAMMMTRQKRFFFMTKAVSC
jgi:hypothetical protein